ncbi:2-C-methyl-D-erythritol 4-phosphate cytidylyltransferase [Fonticella tunisiensis]|uniref:2-C-methyl-D-erythritol 4-phosphate cytidylyltransferase n=1 Tax=Fonticella tunisiensis TaxID=1096341 RepID=A0A4R7KA80_9CLOT|nr:2-C-methyl-D-erythritol 4-phosphate cytidylyltransferase [Fonticella tunisiensis]TDT51256.1 2-C-methyl-D-erythritol 4-phosphate cytidylyltransferase [Fonticella tunisiensis]
MISAVVVAGGKGKRIGRDISKQYIKINEKEILAWTLEVFEKSSEIDEIVLVVPGDDIEFCRKAIVDKYRFAKVRSIVAGGEERQYSVFNGLLSCSGKTEIVVIHDGVRPFINEGLIKRTIEESREFGACAAAVPVKDTIKVVDDKKFIISTPDRKILYAVQTPQTFRYDLILRAHREAMEKNVLSTDDTALVENIGYKVKLTHGDYFNIKITTPEDLIFAEAILRNVK